MKPAGGTKLILLHPKPPRLWLISLLSIVIFLSLISLLHRHSTLPSPTPPSTPVSATAAAALPADLFHVLLHYAADPAGWKLPSADLTQIAAAIRRRSPGNVLIFGLGHETLLWRSINRNGRTVFVDEDSYLISRLEDRHKGLIEAYDVKFPKELEALENLLPKIKSERNGECRPVQNLLYSVCTLAVNDLPNELYEISWDVIIVDGPRGYGASPPGRAAAIFTAAVMARSGDGGRNSTEVLIHDYDRELEKICSDEFLCKENLVSGNGRLGHFSVRRPPPGGIVTDFCRKRYRALKIKRKTVREGSVKGQ